MATQSTVRETAQQLAELKPDTVRIYPTIIMKDTELAQKYLSDVYQPMSLNEAIALCSDLLDFFEEQGIAVIRLGLHSTPELKMDMLAGPWHPAFRELCDSRRILNRIVAYCKEHKIPQGEITIYVAPSCISKATGQRKSNLAKLGELGYQAKIKPDDKMNNLGFYINFK